jgi:hypothetical protein
MLSAAFVPLRLLDRIVVTDKKPDRVFPFSAKYENTLSLCFTQFRTQNS